MERMDFHKPSFFIKGFQAMAIWNSIVATKGSISCEYVTTWRQEDKQETEETKVKRLTERIPHPVGTNTKMEAKMSTIVRSVNLIATAKPASANMKETP